MSVLILLYISTIGIIATLSIISTRTNSLLIIIYYFSKCNLLVLGKVTFSAAE